MEPLGIIDATYGADKLMQNQKELQKKGRESLDYLVDANSNIIIVCWIDNGMVQATLHWYISMATVNFQKKIYTISYTRYKHIKNKQEYFFGKVLGLGEVKG